MIERHRLRALAASNGVATALGGPLPEGRRVSVWIAGDRVVADRDTSARWRGRVLVEEEPVGLAADGRDRLHRCSVLLAAAAGLVPTTGLRLDWVLPASGEAALTGLGKEAPPPPVPAGVRLRAMITAGEPAVARSTVAGRWTAVHLPDGAEGTPVLGDGASLAAGTPIAQVVAVGADRAAAVAVLRARLAATVLAGVPTDLGLLRAVADAPAFAAGLASARDLDGVVHQPPVVEVLVAGTHTTVQDWPGRLGHWAVGVPPSGPMDDLAFRLANRLVGNDPGTAGLELTLQGPTLRFHVPAVVCLAGPAYAATVTTVAGATSPLAQWRAVAIPAGAVLRCGGPTGPGVRASLAIAGGIDVPEFLASRSTFDLGGFGGHAGRPVQPGDLLPLAAAAADDALSRCPPPLPRDLRPCYGKSWEVGVLEGPHAAPEFFTPADMAQLYAASWTVHHHSNRTGVRLVGPKPQWARRDGGEAGLHPSNLHDNAYAVGAIDFTGDMPILLGPDGPSCGGFVCPGVVVAAERWKLGQLRPGDTLRFVRLTVAEAERRRIAQVQVVATLAPPPTSAPPAAAPVRATGQADADPAILFRREADSRRPALTLRRSGDEYLLLEYGEQVLDLELRLRVHLLEQALAARGEPGVVDLTPGVRSLQVHVDPRRLPVPRLVELLTGLDADLPRADEVTVPTRTVHLPLSWDDPATQKAIRIYEKSVRADAPWCPSNLEFIRRINGLASIDDVKRIVYGAGYLVLGLGDVYLGAPVATPLDPRHRLVTTKYNPARTWTPPNAVGIGGAYLCIYGMEGPGGYQFVGRTIPIWNSWRTSPEFAPGRPWLLRSFDILRWHEVGADELLDLRRSVEGGTHRVRIDHGELRWRDHAAFLADHAGAIADFRRTQRAAFDAERERWTAQGT